MAKIKTYAKINWALAVLGVENGFHMLDGVMENIDIYDVVDIEVTDNTDINVTYDTVKTMKGDLCFRAAQAFFDYTKIKKGVTIKVEKKIPMQAGLGGGSSDCACVLWYLNKYFDNVIPQKEFMEIASSLGADVPFFLMEGCNRARGKGEILEKIDKDTVQEFVLVKPINKGVSTKQAFDLCDKDMDKQVLDVEELIEGLKQNNYDLICKNMVNHLEKPSITLLPDIKDIMDTLYNMGAKKAMMTGSGSTVIGVFDQMPTSFEPLKEYWYKPTKTMEKSFEIM